MLFNEFCEQCALLEKTPSRIDKRNILFAVLQDCDIDEIKQLFYFFIGLLPYQNTLNNNLAEKTLLSVLIEEHNKIKPEKIQKMLQAIGDIGLLAKELCQNKQYSLLEVDYIYAVIWEIHNIAGKDSKEKKSNLIAKMLSLLSPLESCYLIRILNGDLRVGVLEKTIVEAMYLFVSDEMSYSDFDFIYSIYPNVYELINLCKTKNYGALKNIAPKIGIPIIPAAADRVKNYKELSFEHLIAQPKYDGMRVQMHYSAEKNELFVFSRNLLPLNGTFPEIEKAFKEACHKKNISSLITDGEIMAYDTTKNVYKTFQDTIQRRRKNDIVGSVNDNPVHYVIFDIMYCNNQSLIKESYTNRLHKIESFCLNNHNLIHAIKTESINSSEEVHSFFMQCVNDGYEGIIIKNSESIYHAGKRSKEWLKWKKNHNNSMNDTLDLVIVGYNYGKGKRLERGIGSLICGAYDHEQHMFIALVSVGTGGNEEFWKNLLLLLEPLKVIKKPDNVVFYDIAPDQFCEPQIVVIVAADAITKAKNKELFSLRFPRIIGIAIDKGPMQVTTLKEMYSIIE